MSEDIGAWSVLWKRQDLPGHEACRLLPLDTGWQLEGVAVFSYDRRACSLEYRINCDQHWVTQAAVVTGWVGNQTIDASISSDGAGMWRLNGRPVDGLAGCVDIDLNFSPSTNLLPIRRLNLEVGATGAVRAAWLRFPSFAVEPLDQSYTRLESRLYRYESAGGRFVAEVTVDETGLVVNYGDIWSRELGA